MDVRRKAKLISNRSSTSPSSLVSAPFHASHSDVLKDSPTHRYCHTSVLWGWLPSPPGILFYSSGGSLMGPSSLWVTAPSFELSSTWVLGQRTGSKGQVSALPHLATVVVIHLLAVASLADMASMPSLWQVPKCWLSCGVNMSIPWEPPDVGHPGLVQLIPTTTCC